MACAVSIHSLSFPTQLGATICCESGLRCSELFLFPSTALRSRMLRCHWRGHSLSPPQDQSGCCAWHANRPCLTTMVPRMKRRSRSSASRKELASSGIDCHPVTREGDPSLEILHLSSEVAADVIVVRTHGRAGLEQALFGSVTEQVLKRSKIPLLLVRPGGRRASDIQKLLVPLDGSPCGSVALQAALKLARPTGTSTDVLQVVVPVPMLHFAAPYDYSGAAFSTRCGMTPRCSLPEHTSKPLLSVCAESMLTSIPRPAWHRMWHAQKIDAAERASPVLLVKREGGHEAEAVSPTAQSSVLQADEVRRRHAE